jgi:hypothetical protein
MRVDTGEGQCHHSVCYASYGYMGDLLRQSERLRWGNLSGACGQTLYKKEICCCMSILLFGPFGYGAALPPNLALSAILRRQAGSPLADFGW